MVCSGAGGTTTAPSTVQITVNTADGGGGSGGDGGDGGGGGSGGGGGDGGGGNIGEGTIITGNNLLASVTIMDTANADDWSVQNSLDTKLEMYGDRSYTINLVPAIIDGATWVQPANDSKGFSAATLASFSAKADVTVYIAHRDDITSKPAWLNAWQDSGADLTSSEQGGQLRFSLYQRAFNTGQMIELGSNGGGGQGMYIAIVAKAGAGGGGSGSAADSDSDNLSDDWELSFFDNLTSTDGSADSDQDGLTDTEEFEGGTNPTKEDTDGDGFTDSFEVAQGTDPNDRNEIPDTDLAPEKPVLPSIGSVSPQLGLDEAPFSDLDTGDAMSQSEWQIASDKQFKAQNLIFSRARSGEALASPMSLSLGILQPGEQYWIRTRHQDRSSLWSEWSVPVQINIEADTNDDDGDGVVDRYQVSADEGIDRDNNGQVDVTEESGICNLRTVPTNLIVAIRTDVGDIHCSTVQALSELPSSARANIQAAPYGFFDFKITGIKPGGSASITIYYPNPLPADTRWYKYDPVTASSSELDVEVDGAAGIIRITLTDGGEGDIDGIENGVIVDPAGIVLTKSQTAAIIDKVEDATSSGAGSMGLGAFFTLILLVAVRRLGCNGWCINWLFRRHIRKETPLIM
jgi:hypothetical protein